MGQGLGKNTPVKLTLGRENYEALLDRHGQWIRWRNSKRCACVNKNTFQPDIHCKLCGGSGYVYSYQPKQTVSCTVMCDNTDGILTLDDEYANDTLVKVYNYSGTIFSNAEKLDGYVFLHQNVTKGSYYNLVLTRENLSTLENVTLTSTTGGYWIVPGLENSQSKTDGVYYTAPSDVISAENIVDAVGNTFEVDEYRLNTILLKEKTETTTDDEGNETTTTIEPVEPLTVETIKYLKPYTFVLLNQNLTKGDYAAMTDINGDAIVLFPYSCDVSDNDVLTVLAGTVTQKDIVAKTGDTIDKLSAYFVADITSITGSDGTEYINGTDYILTGTNNIKWLSDNCPDEGDGYSVTYKIFPTYTVLKEIPQLRSSENQRFPKKAVVKYLANYREQKKVNRQ